MDQNQKIAAMRANPADGHEFSSAKTMARLIIRRSGADQAGPAIERALSLAPSPAKTTAPKVAATAPVTVAAVPAASAATELSKKMPYQPAVILPQVHADPRVAAIAAAAITAQKDRLAAIRRGDFGPQDRAPDRSAEMGYRRPLSGLAAIYAAGQPEEL